MSDKFLSKVVMVNVESHIWSARKKLRDEDFEGVNAEDLPPKKATSLGSKFTINPKSLNPFVMLRGQTEKHCLSFGIKFMGGYAIPEEHFPVVLAQLKIIKDKYDLEIKKFIATYDDAVDSWLAEFPEFEDALRRSVLPASIVERKFGFDFSVYKIQPANNNDSNIPGLDDEVSSMSGCLFKEVAKEASYLLENSLIGRKSITRRTLFPITRIRLKLDALSFLDHRVQPIINSINTCLNQIPEKGSLDKTVFDSVFSLTLLLSDPKRMLAHGEGLSSSVDSFFDSPDQGLPLDLSNQLKVDEVVDIETDVIAEVAVDEVVDIETDVIAEVAVDEVVDLETDVIAEVAVDEVVDLETDVIAEVAVDEVVDIETDVIAEVAVDEVVDLETDVEFTEVEFETDVISEVDDGVDFSDLDFILDSEEVPVETKIVSEVELSDHLSDVVEDSELSNDNEELNEVPEVVEDQVIPASTNIDSDQSFWF